MTGFLAQLKCGYVGAAAAATGVLLLAGCETPNVETSYMLSSAGDKGVAVGSIASSGLLAEYQLLYRKRGGGGQRYFKLQSNDSTLNAALIVAELPADDYEIFKWVMTWPDVSGHTDILPVAPFSIPFRVEPGRALYFGSCEFAPRIGRRFGNIVGADVYCSNKSQRDFMEFASRYPALGEEVSSTFEDKTALYRSMGSYRRYVPRDRE
jgi:hypothetical protein